MPVLLRSRIFLKIFGGIVAVVALFSSSLLVFSVPAIDRQIFAIEARAARTILSNVVEQVQLGKEKMSYFRHLPDFSRVIGAGVYSDDIEQHMQARKGQFVDELRVVLEEIRLADTGYVYVFDADFNMLVHPNPNIQGTNFGALRNPADNQLIAPQLVAAAGRQEGWRYIWDRPDDPGNYQFEKISWVEFLPELGWYIASSVYVEELQRSSGALKQRIMLTTLVILLLSSLGAWFFSRRLTAPLLELSRLAGRVRAGDFSQRSLATGNDEIGVLARTFNQMLDQLAEHLNNLDAKVAERTTELSRALAELQQLEAMKSTFMANISHEMRTPLTSIKGFADLSKRKFEKSILPLLAAAGDAKSAKNGEQIRQNLAIIATESEQLGALIDHALDLVDMEEGKAQWQEELFPLREMVVATVSAWQDAAAGKGLTMRLELPERLPELWGDQGRLRQALGNLLDNAIKFTPDGEIVCRAGAEDNRVTVKVSDSGIGITAAAQEKIFDKFKQGGEILTEKPSGYGLGLAISQRIIEHHGGTIGVTSEPGRGSTFTITLPHPRGGVA